MSSALDAFRAQREAVDQVHARLTEVAELLRDLQAQVDAIAQNQALRESCGTSRPGSNERTTHDRGCPSISRGRDASILAGGLATMGRRCWSSRWPSAAAFGAGYVWASRPYEAELASLRTRVELLDAVAQRVLTMTPAERRQFDALMKWTSPPSR